MPMSPTSRSVRDEVQNFLDHLLSADVALLANPTVVSAAPTHSDPRRVAVSWPEPDSKFLPFRGSPGVATYVHWLSTSQYSAILFDGSLLQLTYLVGSEGICGHRLAYVPCPFELDVDLLRSEPVLDVCDAFGSVHTVALRSAVHFDYDEARSAPDHPTVHMSLNADSCRVPCVAPMRLGHFVEWVFKHFYATLWQSDRYLRSLARSGWGGPTISEPQAQGLHLSWAR